MAYAVTVEFVCAAGAIDRFLPLILENARVSAETEPGCLRFDVLRSAPDRVFLYEIYTDEAAFQAHCRSAHFLAFDAASRPLVKAKEVRFHQVLAENDRRVAR